MAKKLSFLEKRKFVLSVGDEGAILVMLDGKKLLERHFIESPTSGELSNILKQNSSVPIYILVDILDQAYIQHSLPPVSSLNIGQLVKRRLEKDFANEDIKAARKLYRAKEGRRDWFYSFISVHNAPPFSEWLESCVEAENPFRGIYLLPIEAETFIKKLNTAISGKQKTLPEWQVLVSHNKVGGFRQIVFKDGKVIFTRIAQPIGGSAPDVIAGNIEQETLNTIEYVRRLGFESDEKLDVFIIASRSVKAALETNALRAGRVLLFTPDEVAEKLNMPGIAEKTDRFGDVVLATVFANSKGLLKLYSPYAKKVEQLSQLSLAATLAVYIIVPIMAILSLMSIVDISKFNNQIEVATKEKVSAKQKLSEIINKRKELPENADEVLETVRIYDVLSKNAYMPLDVIKKLAEIKSTQFVVNNIEITTDDYFDMGTVIKAKFSLVFSNPSNNIDRVLEDLDAVTESIKEKFKDYNVTFSGLPSESTSLSLDTKTKDGKQTKSLDVTIEGPTNTIPQQQGRRRRR